jgi:sialate O-acetylesterase
LVHQISASKNGNWSVNLAELKAGGPYQMTIKAKNTITINNVLVGDVWVCSGQSQMDMNMERERPLY